METPWRRFNPCGRFFSWNPEVEMASKKCVIFIIKPVKVHVRNFEMCFDHQMNKPFCLLGQIQLGQGQGEGCRPTVHQFSNCKLFACLSLKTRPCSWAIRLSDLWLPTKIPVVWSQIFKCSFWCYKEEKFFVWWRKNPQKFHWLC